jgi:O-antigen/teichoic acid export membrane protein
MIKNIFRGVIGSGLTAIIQIFCTFVITHLVMKNLNITFASAWFLFYSIALLLYISDFGLSPTLAREIAFLHKQQDINKAQLHSILHTSLGLNFYSAIIFCVLFLLGGEYYLHSVFHGADAVIIMKSFMYFMLGSFFLFLNIPLLAIHYGFGHVFTERFLKSFTILFSTILMCVYFSWSHDFEKMCILWFGANLFIHLTIKVYTCFKFKFGFFSIKIEKVCVKRILSMSMQQGLVGLGAWVTFQTGYFISAHQLGAQFVAEYAPLMQVTLGIMSIANLLQYSCTPFISRIYIRGDIKKVVDFVLKFNQLVLLVTITSGVYLFINAPLLFSYWLGSNFHYFPAVFAILLVMVVSEVNHVSFVSNAIACGYLKFMKISWYGACASFTFALILQKYLGLAGVALGLCLGQLATNN